MSEGFDPYADRYEELIDRSVSFSGRGHAFFVRIRAERLLDLVRRRIGDPSNLRALDVGCGVGTMDAHLGAFAALEGVDLSERMVATARERNPRVRYHVGDGKRLPLDDDGFDVAFTSCVLHHVEPPARPAFVAEMARVTRRGGLVVVFEHNPLNPLTRLSVARCEFDRDAVLVPRRETKQRLVEAGLAPVEAPYFLFVPFDGAAVSHAERALRAVPFGAQYYVAARA